MRNETYAKLLRTKEWKTKSKEVKEKAGNICQDCGSDENLQVHHPHYDKSKKPWEYDNLICLCASCHRKADFSRKMKSDSSLPSGDTLRGKWFHSIQHGHIIYQGQILGRVSDGVYLVQFYEWSFGSPTRCEMFSLSEIMGWFFYQSNEQMREQWDTGKAQLAASKRANK